MKHTLIIGTILLSSLSGTLTSCSSNDSVYNLKIANVDGRFLNLSVSGGPKTYSLDSLINNKKDFILFVDDPNVETTKTFLPILHSYIKETEELIYRISSSDYEKRDIALGLPNISLTSLLFIQDGKVKFQEDTNSSPEAFKKLYSLKKLMDKRIIKSYIYTLEAPMLSKDDDITFTFSTADDLYKKYFFDNSSFTVAYYNSTIPSSMNFIEEVIFPFGESFESPVEAISKRIFALDMSTFIQTQEDFDRFNSLHQLPTKNASIPVLARIEKQSHQDMIFPYGGATIKEIDGGFEITDSFYKTLINKRSSKKEKLISQEIDVANDYIKELLEKTVK